MMTGKRVLITGATNGIGKEAARQLAAMDAEIIIVGRNPTKTERVVNELILETGNPNISMMIADLSSINEVKKLAYEFRDKYDTLDVLLNNAGAVFSEYQQSVDGLEMTFALNHINYFVLTNLLVDMLKRTAQEKGEARIINVSSGAHQSANKGMQLSTINDEEAFGGFSTYGKSKLANILFTYELARRLEDTGVTVNALHPGFVSTGFGHNMGGIASFFTKVIQKLFARSEDQGAETPVYLASSPDVKGVTGKYWQDKKAIKSSDISYDRDEQQKLWDYSLEVTGLEEDEKAYA